MHTTLLGSLDWLGAFFFGYSINTGSSLALLTSLGYPVTTLCGGDAAALDPYDQSLHVLHRWGVCLGGPI